MRGNGSEVRGILIVKGALHQTYEEDGVLTFYGHARQIANEVIEETRVVLTSLASPG